MLFGEAVSGAACGIVELKHLAIAFFQRHPISLRHFEAYPIDARFFFCLLK